jgi:hypothetical protein
MFQFEKITVKQILVFCEVLLGSSLLNKEFLEQKYLRGALNFAETVDFLEYIGLTKIRRNRIIPEPRFRLFLERFKKEKTQEQLVKDFILNNLIIRKTQLTSYLEDFLFQFQLEGERWIFAPTSFERLKHSGLRNLLMDLGFIYLDSNERRYIISDDYLAIYLQFRQSHKLSPDEFSLVQNKREEIGRAAELVIMQYEKERLYKYQNLVEKIEHTAKKDVLAGYDIKSFDGKFGKNNNPLPRYIEVKAVSVSDYRFYWTRNEIEKAKLCEQSYYLYLLPVMGERKFDLNSLKIIKNPYMNVYRNKKSWIRAEELLTFSLVKDFDNTDLANLE